MLCSAARSARALCPLPACCPREAIPAQSSGGGTGWGAQRCGVLSGGVALPSLTDSCFGSAPAQDSPLLLNAQSPSATHGCWGTPPHTHTHTQIPPCPPLPWRPPHTGGVACDRPDG